MSQPLKIASLLEQQGFDSKIVREIPSIYSRGKGNSTLAGFCVSGLNLGLGAFAIPSKADETLLVPSPGIAKPEFGYNLRKTI